MFRLQRYTENQTSTPANTNKSKPEPLPVYGYEVVKTYPHDPKAFTEGLFYHDGFLYESTGSQPAKVVSEKGRAGNRQGRPEMGPAAGGFWRGHFDDRRQDLSADLAAADLAVYSTPRTFKLLKEFHYQGDGWGMTTDGTNLYLTQSTHVIKVMDPETFNTVRTIPVMREDGKPLMQINELEWIKGEIWANVWHSEQTRHSWQAELYRPHRPDIRASCSAGSIWPEFRLTISRKLMIPRTQRPKIR